MKETLLLTGLFFGSMFGIHAQTVLFEDNFDTHQNFIITGIGNWSQIDVDGAPTYGVQVTIGGAPVSVLYTNSNYTGTGIIFNPSATVPPLGEQWTPRSGSKTLAFFAALPTNSANPALVGPNNDWFITPQITLNASGNTLSFWAKSVTSQWGLERMRVAVSTTGNTNPSNFTVISGTAVLSVPEQWTQYTYPLDAYAGQQIYIAINYLSNDTFALLVDDFKVTTSTLGIDDHLTSQVSVYPVPANDVINVSNTANMIINSVEIVDLNGRTVKNSMFKNVSDLQINVSDLSSGMYLMNISTDQGKISKKVIKQ